MHTRNYVLTFNATSFWECAWNTKFFLHLFSGAWTNTAWKWKLHILLIFYLNILKGNIPVLGCHSWSFFMKCFWLDLNIARILLLYADAISLFHLSHRYLPLLPVLVCLTISGKHLILMTWFGTFRGISPASPMSWYKMISLPFWL